jgi:hypothetical protein
MKTRITKKTWLVACCLFGTLFFTAGISTAAIIQAAKIEKIATTQWVTPYTSNYYIRVTSTESDAVTGGAPMLLYFMKPGTNTRTGTTQATEGYYATALTAFSLNKTLRLSVVELKDGSLINNLSINASDVVD